jgi:catechol 2,3-dioxygenase-like lactoylglutathione lyase family enzyme
MNLERIDHIQLAMPAGEEERARAFYRDTLGLPELAKPSHLAVRGGAWFESDVVKVHLGVDLNFVAAKKAHPAFIVRDLAGLVERCDEGGYEVVDDEPLEGYRRVYIFDPFGNRLEFMEPTR